jgi:hypothetical protein
MQIIERKGDPEFISKIQKGFHNRDLIYNLHINSFENYSKMTILIENKTYCEKINLI